MASQNRTSQGTNQTNANASAAIGNVVLFGSSGSGKSSLANLIAGKSNAATSHSWNHVSPTFHQDEVVIGGKLYRIWDTSGFDGTIDGCTPSVLREAIMGLLRALSRSGGISLLLFCTRATRLSSDLNTTYNIFYSGICRKKVPVIMVFTSIPQGGGQKPEGWWVENEKDIQEQMLHFDGHLCVTVLDTVTARTMSPTIQRRLQESADSVRTVIASNCRQLWNIDEASWASAAIPDVCSFMNGPDSSAPIPNVVIYDIPDSDLPSPPPSPKSRSRVCTSRTTPAFRNVEINGDQLHVYNVLDVKMDAAMHLYRRMSGRRPDLLIFCASKCRMDTHEQLKKFYTSWAGQTTPLLVVVKGIDTHEEAAEWWRGVYQLRDSEPALVVQLGFLPVTQGAQDVARTHLQNLIRAFRLEPTSGPSRLALLIRWFRQTGESRRVNIPMEVDCLTKSRVWISILN